MGFTVGAGGSGALADGAVTADKIADGAVSPVKLEGTGTPGATTFYRGDGAWETPDGANAYPWTSITQTVGGTGLELTGLDGDVYEVYGMIKSGASSNLIQMEFNGSTGSYAYLQHFSSGSDAGAGSYFLNAAMANGGIAHFRGLIVRNGTNINGHLNTGHQGSGLCHANVNKTISGATKITAVKLTSNQAGGIAADSYIYARKVR